jgi:hypothetical protein
MAAMTSDHGSGQAFLVEAARHTSGHTLYLRFDDREVETTLLPTNLVVDGPAAAARDPILALTLGGVRNIVKAHGFEGGVGVEATLYGVPGSLAPLYGPHLVSIHVFFRLRPPACPVGRLLSMRMSQPMHHQADMPMDAMP